MLIHLVDASAEDVEARFRTIDRELALYGAGLDERPQAVVLNKVDLAPDAAASSGSPTRRIVGTFAVSAVDRRRDRAT